MNFEFLKRVLSALILFPLLVLLLLKAPPSLVNLSLALALVVAWYEWVNLFNLSRVLFFWGLILLMASLFYLFSLHPFLAFIFLFIFSFMPHLLRFQSEDFYKTYFCFATGLFYLMIGFSPFRVFIFEFPRELTLFFFSVVFANDTGAYLTGKFLGRTPFFSKISPKKTWEGFGGGLVLSLLVGYLFNSYFNWWGLKELLIIILLLSLSGVLGDLFESAVKRAVQKKDSGALIPGHGGLLDRIDGVLFASPVFLFILEVFPYGINP